MAPRDRFGTVGENEQPSGTPVSQPRRLKKWRKWSRMGNGTRQPVRTDRDLAACCDVELHVAPSGVLGATQHRCYIGNPPGVVLMSFSVRSSAATTHSN